MKYMIKNLYVNKLPYNNRPGQATGLAMDCGIMRSPTIDAIISVYDKEYPNAFNVDLMNGHLIRWAHQGVFLYNAALTVVQNEPLSHIKIWEPFTAGVINALIQDQNPKVFVGLGKPAQLILGNIPGPHTLLKYEHPVYAARQNRAWDALGIFHKINEIVTFNGRPAIDW